MMPMCCLYIPIYLTLIRVATLPGTIWTGPRIQRTRIDAILKVGATDSCAHRLSPVLSRAPLLHGLALNPAWISNLMPSKVWYEITYPFPTPIFDNHTSNMVTSSGTIRHGQKKFLSCQSDQYLVIMVIYGSPDRFIGRINLATA